MNAITQFEQAVPARSRAGQGTMVEQSRAVAEVQAAVVVAQQRPRDKAFALSEMREVCRIQALAERAFFRYSRGGGQITGASVHLARELARCWGNIDYGSKELSRDDERGQSEMLAFAWDLQTNARAETTFIVPHMRDVKGGPKRLVDMRDIFENNANQAARRLRECIFSVLPVWFTEEAKSICIDTLETGGGKPLVQRIADCVGAFETIGVIRAQLETKVGQRADSWTAADVASLGVVFKSIKAGEINRDEEFPRDELPAKPSAPANADPFEAAAATVAKAEKKAETAKPEQAKAEAAPAHVEPETPAEPTTPREVTNSAFSPEDNVGWRKWVSRALDQIADKTTTGAVETWLSKNDDNLTQCAEWSTGQAARVRAAADARIADLFGVQSSGA